MKRLLLAVALAIGAPAWAQDLVMAVSEGTSGGLDHAQVITKYQGLADVVGRSIRRKVNVVFAREFSQLEEGMKAHRFDFVIARPSDYPARGVQLYGYRFLASAKPDGHCLIIAGKDSGIQKVADLKGKRIVLPEPAAYMTKFCRAELREQGIDLAREKVQYVRGHLLPGAQAGGRRRRRFLFGGRQEVDQGRPPSGAQEPRAALLPADRRPRHQRGPARGDPQGAGGDDPVPRRPGRAQDHRHRRLRHGFGSAAGGPAGLAGRSLSPA